MKQKNLFPVHGLIGTPRPENEINNYLWKDIPVARKYRAPQPPYNPTFNKVSSTSAIVKTAWENLDGYYKLLWDNARKEYNQIYQLGAYGHNAWTFFSTVNMYRYTHIQSITEAPPIIVPNKRIYIEGLIGQETQSDPIIVNYRVEGLFTTPSFVVYRFTNPFSGFLHAFRKSELKYAVGFVPGDFFTIPFPTGQGQHFIYQNHKLFKPLYYWWAETRILTEQYLPCMWYREPIGGLSEMTVISVGTLTQEFFAGPSCGLLQPDTPGGPSWHQNDSHSSSLIQTYSDDALCFFNLPYAPGTVVEKIYVEWSAGTSAPQLKTQYIQKDYTLPEVPETILAQVEENCPAERVVSELTPSVKTLAQNKVYFLRFESNNPTYIAMALHRIYVETSRRVM